MVATQSRLGSVRCAPSGRIAGREELQVVAQIASSTFDRALRASGTDGVMTRPFYTTEEEKTHFRSVPLPLDFSLDGALRKTSWVAERAFGVMTTRLGLTVRVRTTELHKVSCWFESEPCENIPARLQTYLGCEMFRTVNEQ